MMGWRVDALFIRLRLQEYIHYPRDENCTVIGRSVEGYALFCFCSAAVGRAGESLAER